MTAWIGANWCDVLLSGVLAASATLGYAMLYAWLIQLATLQAG